MKKKRFLSVLMVMTVAIGLMALPVVSSAKEVIQQWELVNPEGVIAIKPMELAPRITSLEGKTIVLRWNSKHNGNNFLDRVAELLAKEVPSAKVIKLYETDPSTNTLSMSNEKAEEIAKKIAALKPDLVIASQAD
jgi:ABC-type Fe3+-hydroxamate transport system substrate-binding protein